MRCRQKNPSEGHCLASQGFAEWCQTVIPRKGFFYSHQTATVRFFFLYTFWPLASDFNVGVTINVSHSYPLMWCCNEVNSQHLNDRITWPPIETCYYSFFIYLMSRKMVCKIKFVSTGENRRKTCLVCKIRIIGSLMVVRCRLKILSQG